MNWQPTLYGAKLLLRPLDENDFETLYQVASDPLIWEQHPDRERYTRERFQQYFRSGMSSKVALAICDLSTGQIIGSSRFADHDPSQSSVEIGYTFLSRPYWGGGYNQELKTLMLNYAFRFVETVFFFVGDKNFRSQKAMQKIGGLEVERVLRPQASLAPALSVIYEMKKSTWKDELNKITFVQPELSTSRLALDPITEAHAEELWELFNDPLLHEYVPFEHLTLAKQKERFARWARRRSPDGKELWLNWVGREKQTRKAMAHFQAGIRSDGIASIGYLVARDFQRKQFAFEGLQALFQYLSEHLFVREVKAWCDTRNLASQNLAKKLGMVQIDFIEDADRFGGSMSDEYVYSKILR